MGECMGLEIAALDGRWVSAWGSYDIEHNVPFCGLRLWGLYLMHGAHMVTPYISHMQAVPFRNPHLDPMSPSGLASPPSGIVSPTIMPPAHMTMLGSPPKSRGGAAGATRGGMSDPDSLTEALMGLSSTASEPPKLWQRRAAASNAASSEGGPNAFSQASSPSPSYLGCLLPPEARGLTVVTTTAVKKLTASQSPDKGGGSVTSASSPSQPIHILGSPSGLARGDLTSISGGGPIVPSGSPLSEAAVASTTPPKAAISASPPDGGGHYGRIRQELGKGEGVTALLERSRKAGPVVASEDDAGQCLSDDEAGRGGGGGGLPMSPTTRLRRDTFGATLDFVEALCDASSSLATFSHVRLYI